MKYIIHHVEIFFLTFTLMESSLFKMRLDLNFNCSIFIALGVPQLKTILFIQDPKFEGIIIIIIIFTCT